MSLIASTITKACFAWMLFYVLLGASPKGKAFFSDLASTFFDDAKGGSVLLTLTYPLLIATCVCALLTVRRPCRTCLCPPKSNRWRIGTLRSIFQRIFSNHGDGNFDLYAVVFLLIPLLSYAAFGIHRRTVRQQVSFPLISLLTGKLDEDAASELTMGVGNAFGMTAVVAMAFFLVPASKYGPIMKLFGWSHAVAIRLHIWAGRAIVIAAFCHGMCHTIRWKFQFGEDIQSFLFPPWECWAADENFTPTCKNQDSDCTCYDHFLYFSGTIAALMLFIILITSSNWVRRKCYNVFLTCHLLVAPLFFFMVIFHYNRAILYASPSILYYLATTLPPYMERRRNVGVHVTSVEVIGTTFKHVSLTFEATREAVRAFRPGMYTNLSVPSISNLAHPFTVNRVPGSEDELRIIFKVTGPFTKQLATLLEAESGIPTIQMDGLHGCPCRMHQLRHHDINVIVAGGIGVTPFLSLIVDTVATNADDGKILPHYASRLNHLSMHWVCRDSSLIEYVRTKYLNELEGRRTPYCDTRIHLYHTGSESEISIKKMEYPSETVQITEPFQISRFAPAATVRANLVPFLALCAIIWPGLAIIWNSYCTYHDSDSMLSQGIGPLAFMLYAVAASFVVSRIFPYSWFGKSSDTDHFKLKDDSGHSYEEVIPLSRSSSATGEIAQTMDDEIPNKVTLEAHIGRPDMESVAEPLNKARWPAVFSCGPVSMVKFILAVVEEKSFYRNSTEPSRQSPLVTVFDETFYM